MSGFGYSVNYAGTVTNAGGNTDLIEIMPGDDKPVELVGFSVGQYSEVGDTAEEGMSISIIRLPATVTSGSGGATPVTGKPKRSDLPSAGFTAEANNTTVATTSGSAETLEELAWNNRASPLEKWYPDEEFRYTVRQGEALVIRLNTTVADDISLAITAWVKEL